MKNLPIESEREKHRISDFLEHKRISILDSRQWKADTRAPNPFEKAERKEVFTQNSFRKNMFTQENFSKRKGAVAKNGRLMKTETKELLASNTTLYQGYPDTKKS